MRTAQETESKRFSRQVEDFTCAQCRARNRGNGYTNHCRRCLWSRHVDVHPGDRAAPCGGMMEPVGVETGGDRITLLHRCETCGHQSRCRTSPDDDWDAISAVSATGATRAG